ncbi:MAG TPA: 50S ribosomal protein L11 methyltransferase [Candidatus Latescibacteria bacterium]|nr:50S ribosomal protein L11 methyltransferase [Candidatus Latescibacterota bacterium]
MDGTACVRIEAPSALEDAIVNFLFELGCSGTRVDDVGGKVRVEGYCPDPEAEKVREALGRYVSSLKDMGLWEGVERVEVGSVQEVQWEDIWRSHFRPTLVGRKLVVHPPWEAPPLGRVPIEIEPGMAFGTGCHPTTQLCLEALEELISPGIRVLDLGTGTGILAIAAAKLEAREVVALDTDPEAVRSAGENVARNGVGSRVKVVLGSLGDELRGPFQLVLANLYLDLLLGVLPPLKELMSPGARAIFSGLLSDDLPAFFGALEGAGYRSLRDEVRDGWAVVVANVP